MWLIALLFLLGNLCYGAYHDSDLKGTLSFPNEIKLLILNEYQLSLGNKPITNIGATNSCKVWNYHLFKEMARLGKMIEKNDKIKVQFPQLSEKLKNPLAKDCRFKNLSNVLCSKSFKDIDETANEIEEQRRKTISISMQDSLASIDSPHRMYELRQRENKHVTKKKELTRFGIDLTEYTNSENPNIRISLKKKVKQMKPNDVWTKLDFYCEDNAKAVSIRRFWLHFRSFALFDVPQVASITLVPRICSISFIDGNEDLIAVFVTQHHLLDVPSFIFFYNYKIDKILLEYCLHKYDLNDDIRKKFEDGKLSEFFKTFTPDDYNQLIFAAQAFEWLSKQNAPIEEGKEILKMLKDPKNIKNKYKLIWRTTTEKHGNLFKQINDKVNPTNSISPSTSSICNIL